MGVYYRVNGGVYEVCDELHLRVAGGILRSVWGCLYR